MRYAKSLVQYIKSLAYATSEMNRPALPKVLAWSATILLSALGVLSAMAQQTVAPTDN